jgi:hypothetical protein
MFRRALAMSGGAAFVLAVTVGPTIAQRPAAWDTRVVKPPPTQPAEPSDQPTAPPKNKPPKSLDNAGSGKPGKPKSD